VARLGRATSVFQTTCWTAPQESAAAREQFREAHAMARREVEAGRPCVVWGAYAPEFAAVVGVTSRSYLVKSFVGCAWELELPIPFDGLHAPGGAYVLAFPIATERRPGNADHEALANAVARFRTPSGYSHYQAGAAAYDLWIAELQAGRADAGGNSYNAACYAEGRRFAREFLLRVAGRNPAVAGALATAIQDYTTAAEAMEQIAALFPCWGQSGMREEDQALINGALAALPWAWHGGSRAVENQAAINTAVVALRTAQEAESRAVERLAATVAGEWVG
jgi:hypothetical protein